MKIRNIWEKPQAPLEMHEDARGRIVDVYYGDEIQHVSVIESHKAGAIRGNHYHRETIQHMLITKGSLEYWWKPLESSEPAKMVVARRGDLVETPTHEIHALKILEENEFIVFTKGLRGGMDYEKDTIRVEEKDKILK